MTERPRKNDRGRIELTELAALFLRLGATAFGGPAVHIAMMEEEVVRRRRWLRPRSLPGPLGATNLIPGSTVSWLILGGALVGLAKALLP